MTESSFRSGRILIGEEVNSVKFLGICDGEPLFVTFAAHGIVSLISCSDPFAPNEIDRLVTTPPISLIDGATLKTGDSTFLLIAVGIAEDVPVIEVAGCTLRQISTWTTPQSSDNRSALSIDEKSWFLIGGVGGSIHIINRDGAPIDVIEGPHTSTIRSMAHRNGMVATGGQDRRLAMWAIDDDGLKLMKDLPENHNGWIWNVSIDDSCKKVFSVGSDGRLGLVLTDRWYEGYVAEVNDRWLMSVALVGDDLGLILCGDSAGVLHTWRNVSFELISSARLHSDEINRIALDDSCNVVATASRDGTVAFFPLANLLDEALQAGTSTRWLSDCPPELDLLGRTRIASFLAKRISEFLQSDESDQHRAILVSGPWGAGKTTLVKMVLDQLDPSLVAKSEVDAWSTIGRGISWTEFVESIISSYVVDVWKSSKSKWIWLRIRLIAALARFAISPPLGFLVVLGLVLGAIATQMASGTAVPWETVGTLLTGVGAILAAVASSSTLRRMRSTTNYKISRWETHDARNPIMIARAMLTCCMEVSGKPFVLMIDNLDRCSPSPITEALESIHSVFTNGDLPRKGVLILSADESWIRRSFEIEYSEMTTQDSAFGSTAGSRFMEKLFYLVMPTGRLSSAAEERYLAEVLTPSHSASATDDDQATHIMHGFRELLPDNPRTIVRTIVLYESLRELKSAEGVVVSHATLMLWSIIRARWPEAAIALAADPNSLDRTGVDGSELSKWMSLPEVRRVLNWKFGGPLRSEDVLLCASEI
jgi:hypothetical protein